MIEELVQEEQFPKILVTLMSDNLARVYANSKRADQDFREFPPVLRQAVSLARRFQDPLIEFSQLTGPENEILALRYAIQCPKSSQSYTVWKFHNFSITQFLREINFVYS